MKNHICDMKHPYLKAFFSAFFVFLISMIPILILSGGVYLSVGDYNLQTIPFLEHVHNLIFESDSFPTYDMQSDLGMNFITAYGGFMFSPFAAILVLLPTKVAAYVHTVVMALKFGVAAATTLLYCRQYVKKDSNAYICAMLYAFSGFSLFNLCYQFMDTICLFPLTLYAFDKLVNDRRPFGFAIMLAINGYISYFFLWEECVFILMYYIVRVKTKSLPKVTVKQFVQLGIETLCGVFMTFALLLPSAVAISGNSRASETIFGNNLLAYSESGTVLKIIQSMFMPPEICANGWYFTSRELTVSAPALYIPMFTVVGVAAIIRHNKKSWESILLMVSALTACVPLLNSVFGMFNNYYYSRWFYMPLLIMVMLTGKYLDNYEQTDVSRELKIGKYIMALLVIVGIYIFIYNIGKFKALWVMNMIAALLGFIVLWHFAKGKNKFGLFIRKYIKPVVCIMCLIPFLCRSFYVDYATDDGKNNIIRKIYCLWNDFQPIDLDDNVFFRTSTRNAAYNTGINWGYPTVDTFNSLISGQEVDFYDRIGFGATNVTKMENNDYALDSFLSVKYDLALDEDMIGRNKKMEYSLYGKNKDYTEDVKEGFEYMSTYNAFHVYKNKAYIPMGFTYDYYIMDDEFQEYSNPYVTEDPDTQVSEKLILKAICLDETLADKYSNILKPLPNHLKEDTSDETYYKDCKARADSACYEFNTVNDGFNAKIDLEKDNLVFFSVPYDKGFTAYVDGQETEIERVFDGLSAVYVPKGDHSIEFKYTVPGLKTGIIVSVGSAAILAIYGTVALVLGRKNKSKDNET